MQGNMKLSKEEVEAYFNNGYLGPFTLCSPEEMAEIRKEIDQFITDQIGAHHHNRHLDKKVVYDLCSHPAVTDRLMSLLGENIVLWRSNFFAKYPGDSQVPWHQDANYWPIEPVVNISVWLAIDEVLMRTAVFRSYPEAIEKYCHISKMKI